MDRKRLAYMLATHLCYSGIQPDDKAIDVLLERWESYTPDKEQRRRDDLLDSWREYKADEAT